MSKLPWRLSYNTYTLSFPSWEAALHSALHFQRFSTSEGKPRIWKRP